MIYIKRAGTKHIAEVQRYDCTQFRGSSTKEYKLMFDHALAAKMGTINKSPNRFS